MKERENMIIKGMKHFQNVVKKKLAEWYTYDGDAQELYEDVYKKLTNTHYTEK